MLLYLYAENVSPEVELPRKGWETVIWLRSWSDISNDIFYHLIRIYRVENARKKPLYQAHFQLFRNDAIRKYDLIEELAETY